MNTHMPFWGWIAIIAAVYLLGVKTGWSGRKYQSRHRKTREEPSRLFADPEMVEHQVAAEGEDFSDFSDLLPLAQDYEYPRCHECGSWYVTIQDMDVPGRFWCGDHGYVPQEESPTLPFMERQETDLLARMSDFLNPKVLSAAFA